MRSAASAWSGSMRVSNAQPRTSVPTQVRLGISVFHRSALISAPHLMTGSVILGPHEASVNRQMHLPSEGTRSRCWLLTDVLAEEPLIGRARGEEPDEVR